MESELCIQINIQKVKSTADYAPVDTVINWIGCVHEQEKVPKRGEGVKWKKVQACDAELCLLCNSLLLNTEWPAGKLLIKLEMKTDKDVLSEDSLDQDGRSFFLERW